MRRLMCCLLAALCMSAAALAESERADRLVISLAGDCTLGSEDRYAAVQTSFTQVVVNKGLDWPFSGVIHLFGNDDLTLVNLEGVFTDYKRAAKKKFTFRAPPGYADILTLGSVEAVNLANNHSLDFGERGLDDTRRALDERGIAYCANTQPVVLEVKGCRIAMLGMSYSLSSGKVKALCGQIASYRADPAIDLIIVSFHWGIEMRYRQAKEQIDTARRAIESGADIVVGTHPHVLQGMEMYQGRPVFYSLGNFSFGGNASPKDFDTAVIQLEYDISGKAAGEKPTLARLEVIPYLITEIPLGLTQDYRPVEASGEDARRVLRKLSWGNKGLPEGFFDTGYWELDGDEKEAPE